MSPVPPARAPRESKRPWYLLAALLASLAFGISGGCDGFHVIGAYRADHIDLTSEVSWVADDADREHLLGLAQQQLEVIDLAKNRVFPLAVGGLLIGLALAFFAMRAMSGRGSARGPLCQVVLVQAALGIGAFFVHRDVRSSQLDYTVAVQDVKDKQLGANNMVDRMMLDAERWAQPLQLVLRSLGSIFIVVALTRRRSIAFFDAETDKGSRPDPRSPRNSG